MTWTLRITARETKHKVGDTYSAGINWPSYEPRLRLLKESLLRLGPEGKKSLNVSSALM